MSLLQTLEDGRKHEIDKDLYEYFLEVLPPVAFNFTWNGEKWGFGFAEGHDYVYAFRCDGDAFYAQKTDLVNPYECGISIGAQLNDPDKKAARRFELLQSAHWIPDWLRAGRLNPWIRKTHFHTRSITACLSDDDLLDKLEQGHWPAGTAFCRGDLCLIQEEDQADSWLTIHRGRTIQSISLTHIIKEEGRDFARKILEDIRAATVPMDQISVRSR